MASRRTPTRMHALLLGLGAMMAACAPPIDADGIPNAAALEPARTAITADGMMAHIQALAHDSMEGRAPGTVGEARTVRYVIDQFTRLGLAPAGSNGSWVQDVQLVGITSRPEGRITRDGRTSGLAFPRDYVIGSKYPDSIVQLDNSELVFVGYGVTAPEYGWDDYAGVDVTGKTVVVLINDPPVRDARSGALDPAVFKGDAMTYYGRWMYKYENASRHGAAGVLIVHETEPAGYPYLVVIGSWGRENFDIKTEGGPSGRVTVEGWLSRERAVQLFSDAGLDFETVKAQAAQRDFRPVPLGASVSFTVTQQVREVASRNVVAKLDGADARMRDEWVVYSAHWDHLGRDTLHGEDPVFNGALDNASGTAMMLEIAGALARLPEKTPRSVLFVAFTAEEQGLLGAKWYAEHPVVPLEKTVANINMDGINQWGRTRDLTVVGRGSTTLEDELRVVAEREGRVLSADLEPEKGYYFRSDHFELAKKGVPALYLNAGTAFVGKPEGYGAQKRAEFTANDYHKPSDEVKPDWDLSGAVEDARALLEVGWRVANRTRWPEWLPGTEFKAVRDSALGSASPQTGVR